MISRNVHGFGGLQGCVGYRRLELVGLGFDGYNQSNQGREFADVCDHNRGPLLNVNASGHCFIIGGNSMQL